MIRFIYMYKVLLLSLLLCFTLLSCQEDRYYKIGKEAVIRIEKFKQEHHRLPNDLEEIGIMLNNNDRFFYEKMTDEEYRLEYFANRKHMVSYTSRTKQWQFGLWYSSLLTSINCVAEELIRVFFWCKWIIVF